MAKSAQIDRLLASGIAAVVRAPSGDALVDVAEALSAGGIDVVEITFTIPRALSVLEQVADRLGDRVLLGAGTVLDAETARSAMLAGAEFVVSPVVRHDVIRVCRRYDKLVIPGALTPTEVLDAHEAGGDVIKVFPSDVSGPRYLKALRGPLPQVRLMPTGGVDLTTASEFLKAGACALGIGGALVSADAVARRDFVGIESLARQYVEIVRKTRRETANKP